PGPRIDRPDHGPPPARLLPDAEYGADTVVVAGQPSEQLARVTLSRAAAGRCPVAHRGHPRLRQAATRPSLAGEIRCRQKREKRAGEDDDPRESVERGVVHLVAPVPSGGTLKRDRDPVVDGSNVRFQDSD